MGVTKKGGALRKIYLSTPYSHESPNMRYRRFQDANRVAAKLMLDGNVVFSPISHSHPISICMDNSIDGDFWLRQDLPFLRWADEMVVIKQPGWEESAGVQAEIEMANELSLPIRYLEATL